MAGDTSKESSNREKALKNTLTLIERNFGKGSIMRLGDATRMRVETFPSGSLTLDLALGGGFPKGRIVEIYGPESSGKTTVALHAIAEVQKAASVLQLDTICIRGNAAVGGIEIIAFDRKIGLNSTSKTYKVPIKAKVSNPSLSVYIDIELMKMLSDDYSVEIGGTAVAKFVGNKNGVTYWIALRSDSK